MKNENRVHKISNKLLIGLYKSNKPILYIYYIGNVIYFSLKVFIPVECIFILTYFRQHFNKIVWT